MGFSCSSEENPYPQTRKARSMDYKEAYRLGIHGEQAETETKEKERPYFARQQAALACCLVYDNSEDASLLAQRVDPSCFTEIYEPVVRIALEYRKEFGKAMTISDLDILLEQQTDILAEVRLQLAADLLEQWEEHPPNAKLLLKEMRKFNALAHLHKAWLEGSEALGARDLAGVEAGLARIDEARKVLSDDEEEDSTSDMLEVLDDVLNQSQLTNEFSVGNPVLNKLYIRPQRKQLMVLQAPTNEGKSFQLQEIALYNAYEGKRVLFVTLEMSKEEFGRRCYQQLYSGARRGNSFPYLMFEEREDGLAIVEHTAEAAFTFDREDSNPNLIDVMQSKRTHKVYDRDGRLIEERRVFKKQWALKNLKVVHWSPGTASVADIEAVVASLKPDLVAVDYLGELNFDGKQDRFNQIGEHVTKLRALADKYNCAVVTANQINREGMKAKRSSMEFTGEGIKVVQKADMVLSFTPDEKFDGKLGIITVDKARGEARGMKIAVTRLLDLGFFTVSAVVADYHFRKARDAYLAANKEAKPEDDKPNRKDQVKQLLEQGMSQSAIAKELDVAPSYISRLAKEIRAEG